MTSDHRSPKISSDTLAGDRDRRFVVDLFTIFFAPRRITFRHGRYVPVKFSLWQKVVLPGTKPSTVRARKLP
jgi:hypothetical protein